MTEAELIGEAAETAWARFFRGSVLAQDVLRERVARRYGLEQGGDLLLPARWRELTCGTVKVLQVKTSVERAIDFLHEGGLRGNVIPVVIGSPPVDGYQMNVLLALKQQYVWFPRRLWERRCRGMVERLDTVLHALRLCRVPLVLTPPRWCERVMK